MPLKGEFRIPFTDGRVATIRAGEAYYLPLGHRFEVVADAEVAEFSPTRELREVYGQSIAIWRARPNRRHREHSGPIAGPSRALNHF